MRWKRYTALSQDEETTTSPDLPMLARPKIWRTHRAWLALGPLSGLLLVIVLTLTLHRSLPPMSFPSLLNATREYNAQGSQFFFDEARGGWLPFASNQSAWKPRLNSSQVTKTRAQQVFSPACADLWIAKAQLCDELRGGDSPLARSAVLDAVFSWQNSTNPQLQAARVASIKADSTHHSGLAAQHYRNHDELRHSMRAVRHAFSKSAALRKMYIYTSDLPVTETLRAGLIPTWLDSNHLTRNETEIVPLFPYNTFRSTAFGTDQEAHDWRAAALPTFQSQSIESQMAYIDRISDTWLYLCDDFFVLNYLAASDIQSPLYGPVFRVQRDLLVTGHAKGTDSSSLEGEWRSLSYANSLIDDRFGQSSRPYPAHTIKTYNAPLLQELESIWAEELADTATIRFRGRGTEVNMAHLFIHFVVERHREALLWSFVVGRADANGDGRLDANERQEMISMLSSGRVTALQNSSMVIPQPQRPGEEEWHTNMLLAGLEPPLQTTMAWSSANGFAYLSNARTSKWGSPSWPNFSADPADPAQYTDAFYELEPACLLPEHLELTASRLFKHVAFESRACGDAIIAALLGQSAGLDAFLPPKRSPAHSSSQLQTTAVLPLNKRWQDGDFSLAATVPAEITPRGFAVSLLQRYSYTLGDTPLHFLSMRGGRSVGMKLMPLLAFERAPKGAAVLLALNDDLSSYIDDANRALQIWFSDRFPWRGFWEKAS